MTIRILIYTHAFAPQIGGVETIVGSLAAGLSHLRSGDDSASTDITVVTRTPQNGFDDSSLSFWLVRQPSFLQLTRLIWTADVLHLAGPCFLPILIALLLRKPVVVEHHGFQTICPNGQLFHEPSGRTCPGHFMAGRYAECLRCNAKTGLLHSLRMCLLTFPRRWLSTHVKSNVMPTNFLAGLLQLPRATTVYHGLPRAGDAGIFPLNSAHPTFAFVGRLVSTKGVRTLLEAAQQLRAQGFRYRLKIIGDGPDRDALQQQSTAWGLGEFVQFLGYVPAERLGEQLADATAVVMPSLAGEVFGMVAAENMLRGKVVIVSDIGAMREVIGDAGLSFMPGDSGGLAQCMEEVLRDAGLAARLGSKAQARASAQFDERKMLLEHFNIYRNVLASMASSAQEGPC